MKRLSAVLGLVALVLAVGRVANAADITLTVGAGGTATDYIVGEVFYPGILSGGLAVRDAASINGLIALNPDERTTQTALVPEYYRSSTNFGTLPTAIAGTAALAGSIGDMTVSGDTVLVTLSDTYQYLMATYDGPHGGAEVWYIGGFAPGTTFILPLNAQPLGDPQNLAVSNKYQMTAWTAFNPVPDGGSMAMLLGVALMGLGGLRRFMK